MKALDFRAGPKALAHLRQYGLHAEDIAAIPAAAGGPKGLILQALDQWLFGTWLSTAPRERSLLGASIGAWRMAAACDTDPAKAFQRLGNLYCEQRYPNKPPPDLISGVIRQLLQNFIGGREAEIVGNRHYRLHVLTVRGRNLLQAPQRKLTTVAGFAGAALSNLRSRDGLRHSLERVVIGDARDPLNWMKTPFDGFTTHFAPLTQDNLGAALLASGTLPLMMQPVQGIPHAPSGFYWDGGMIDYHLAFPYSTITEQSKPNLVLYPHFSQHIVPGWLDKTMPWRQALPAKLRHWYDNVLLISPSQAFQQTLPRGKLPDREDFHHYGLDHDARILNWKKAMAEGQRMRDELVAFVEKPDLSLVRPLY